MQTVEITTKQRYRYNHKAKCWDKAYKVNAVLKVIDNGVVVMELKQSDPLFGYYANARIGV